MTPPSHPPRLLRAASAGAWGGVVAGVADFALAYGRSGTFLPHGKIKLLWFLCALYGSVASLLAIVVAIASALLSSTEIGRLWRIAFCGEKDERGSSAVALIVGLVCAAGLTGYGLFYAAAIDLQRFHHRLLISALVGTTAAGLALGGAAVTLLVATLLPLRSGRRVYWRFATPIGALAAGWALGLVLGAGAVTETGLWLFGRHLSVAAHAAYLAFLALPILKISVVLGDRLARLLWPKVPVSLDSKLRRPGGALTAVALALLLPLSLVAVINRHLLGELDLRPFFAPALALGAALGVAVSGRRQVFSLDRWFQFALMVAIPIVLFYTGSSMARNDRVRKAAISYTGVCKPLLSTIQALTDFDHDGYSSLFGGGDCNDSNRRVHPGAFDWPDDGVDQNCNGHEATLQTPHSQHFSPVPATVPQDLNILLLTIDALRADHVGIYGYFRPTTPNLDALSKESSLFWNGWAHAPSTRYSVPAILTGRYPSTIAVGNAHWPPNLLPENRLAAEIFHDLDYHTGATLSYYYFEPAWGLSQGFDDYDTHLKYLHSEGGDPAATTGSSARELADLDIAYIDKHKGEKFFLWSHFYDSHFRFERHAEPATHFGEDEIALYDGEIRYTDMQLGRVFDALKKNGLWEKTIIVVTADHGDGFGEHGLPPSQRHGYHLYRTETKVPLMIYVPGLKPQVVSTPAGHIDILPTLLNLLRQPENAEPTLAGDSLLRQMLGAEGRRQIFQEVWYEGPTSRKAVVSEDWHLIANLVPDGTFELYRFVDDTAENRDLYGEGTKQEIELKALLGKWMDEVAMPADFQKRAQGNLSLGPLAFSDSLGDKLGEWISIDGIDVKTPSVMPGTDAEFSLYLHGLAEVPAGWRLFTHLTARSGQFLNGDHDPVENLVSLSDFSPGLYARDRVAVRVPANWPEGPLTVEVGLWRGRERAKTSGPHSLGDQVRVTTIEVQR